MIYLFHLRTYPKITSLQNNKPSLPYDLKIFCSTDMIPIVLTSAFSGQSCENRSYRWLIQGCLAGEHFAAYDGYVIAG